MKTENELLEEISNTISLQSFVLSRELVNITPRDLYKIADDMEHAIGKLFIVADKIQNKSKVV